MPKKENSARLGKGLSAIFGEDVNNVLEDIQQGKTEVHEDSKFEVAVKDVKPNPYQPRKNFDDDKIQELADSIRLHGVFTPILVKKAVKGYELIAGERRLRASKVAGLKTIPAILMELDHQQMMEIALLENIQREDLNAIEEAQGYEKLIKKLDYTQEELAKRIGKSREHVANMLRLLKLPKAVQQYVIDKQLSMGHVRALLGIKDATQIEDVAKKAKEMGSTRATASMDKAAELGKPLIFAIGNAPTALVRLYELINEKKISPYLIIGVPVGFVNVVQSKEMIMDTDVPYIVARGRKGGSNIAACICNALLYMIDNERDYWK